MANQNQGPASSDSSINLPKGENPDQALPPSTPTTTEMPQALLDELRSLGFTSSEIEALAKYKPKQVSPEKRRMQDLDQLDWVERSLGIQTPAGTMKETIHTVATLAYIEQINQGVFMDQESISIIKALATAASFMAKVEIPRPKKAPEITLTWEPGQFETVIGVLTQAYYQNSPGLDIPQMYRHRPLRLAYPRRTDEAKGMQVQDMILKTIKTLVELTPKEQRRQPKEIPSLEPRIPKQMVPPYPYLAASRFNSDI